MITHTQRRHSRWYEVILFNQLFLFVLGFAVVVFLPAYAQWGDKIFQWPMVEVRFNTLIANSLAYCASFYILRKLKCYPGTRTLPFIIPTVLTTWLATFSLFLFWRGSAYSLIVLSASFTLAMAWAFAGHFLSRRFKHAKLAIVPFGRALELVGLQNAQTDVL